MSFFVLHYDWHINLNLEINHDAAKMLSFSRNLESMGVEKVIFTGSAPQ
jgi:hypothetical protein